MTDKYYVHTSEVDGEGGEPSDAEHAEHAGDQAEQEAAGHQCQTCRSNILERSRFGQGGQNQKHYHSSPNFELIICNYIRGPADATKLF